MFKIQGCKSKEKKKHVNIMQVDEKKTMKCSVWDQHDSRVGIVKLCAPTTHTHTQHNYACTHTHTQTPTYLPIFLYLSLSLSLVTISCILSL